MRLRPGLPRHRHYRQRWVLQPRQLTMLLLRLHRRSIVALHCRASHQYADQTRRLLSHQETKTRNLIHLRRSSAGGDLLSLCRRKERQLRETMVSVPCSAVDTAELPLCRPLPRPLVPSVSMSDHKPTRHGIEYAYESSSSPRHWDRHLLHQPSQIRHGSYQSSTDLRSSYFETAWA